MTSHFSYALILPYAGPPYCPVRNIPSPYDNSYIPPKPPKSPTATSTFNPNDKLVPPPVTTPTQYESQYPTLPTLEDVEGRLNNGQQQNPTSTYPGQQQYPAPTYPGQNEYQKRGVPYNSSANETTKLLN